MARFPRNFLPVGTRQPADVPYDQSGVTMSSGGMQIPEPNGAMRKMQFEFSDPAEQQMQAAQAQAQQAAIMPAGAGGGQPQPQQQQAPPQGQPQAPAGGLWGQMAGGGDQMGQGEMSSMLSDDQLAAMANDDQGFSPIDLQADMMEEQLPNDPQLQMQMMMAARRMGGF